MREGRDKRGVGYHEGDYGGQFSRFTVIFDIDLFMYLALERNFIA